MKRGARCLSAQSSCDVVVANKGTGRSEGEKEEEEKNLNIMKSEKHIFLLKKKKKQTALSNELYQYSLNYIKFLTGHRHTLGTYPNNNTYIDHMSHTIQNIWSFQFNFYMYLQYLRGN